MQALTSLSLGPLASRLRHVKASASDLHVRVVKHLNGVYYIVFKDHTVEFITDVWIRDYKADNQRRCLWTHAAHAPLTQRLKNICAKAIQQS